MARPKKNLVPQTFIDASNMMTTEDLRAEILKATDNIDKIVEGRENDNKFQALKESYQDAAAGYRDGINTEKAKIEFAKLKLKERGQATPGPTTAPVAIKVAKAS